MKQASIHDQVIALAGIAQAAARHGLGVLVAFSG